MIDKIIRKSLGIKPSGRSSDFITPSFGHGCLYKCHYCYMRRNKRSGVTIATNLSDIFQSISKHVETLPFPKQPNQTHDTLYTYDFSCNEDFVLHLKYHNWKRIFTYFKKHPKILGTAATKFVNQELLTFYPNKKIRIRMSLMPQILSDILEPNTSKIIDRIKFINILIQSGYDVHVNISPIIITKEYKQLYKDLLICLDSHILSQYKHIVKAECIMLTHNQSMHQVNLFDGLEQPENILYNPLIQEPKRSQHGGYNVRYKTHIKANYINQFKQLVDKYCNWLVIRYIF